MTEVINLTVQRTNIPAEFVQLLLIRERHCSEENRENYRDPAVLVSVGIDHGEDVPVQFFRQILATRPLLLTL